MTRIALFAPALLLASCSSQPADAPVADASETAVATASPDGQDAQAATAAAQTVSSRYTSFKDCKLIEEGQGEDWSISRCRGLGGIGIKINYGDARDDLEIERPGKPPVELKLPYLAGGGFNALGDTAEWRGKGHGAGFVPTALIVRNTTADDPENPAKHTSLLVVVDLAQGCVLAQVQPGPGQNEKARAIADRPGQPCFKESE